MICVTICGFGYDACRHALRRAEKHSDIPGGIMAEVRLDLCGLSEEETELLFLKSKIPLIATIRRKSRNLLLPAVFSGAEYVDIDGIAPDGKIDEIIGSIAGHRTGIILSYQDYTRTPSLKELRDFYKRGVGHGADMIRIVTTAQSIEDSERVLSLYQLMKAGELGGEVPLVAYTMGYYGSYTGFEACSCGAPLLFCSPDEKTGLYPGMPVLDQVKEFSRRRRVEGEIHVPGSKDMTQKAILASLLSVEESTVFNYSSCKDNDSALSLARRRAHNVTLKDGVLTISGGGLHFGGRQKSGSGHFRSIPGMFLKDSVRRTVSDTNFVGESGLLARMCFPLVAQIGHQVTITGEGHLMDRAMSSCREALEKFGASCILTSEGTLPAIVNGPLTGGDVTISAEEGTQLISGLLMALPLSRNDSELRITDLKNLPYLLTTVEVIQKFGIKLSYRLEGDVLIFDIPGRQKYHPAEIRVEGDWSSGANFVVAAAIFGKITLYGLNQNSSQADREILEIVRSAGARTFWKNGVLTVRRDHLSGFRFDVSHNPDLFSILAVLASYCEGTSTISGLDHIRYRDSRRVDTVCRGLKKMGVKLEQMPESVTIRGICPARRQLEHLLLRGGEYLSEGDHRVAMALQIAALGCDGSVTVDDMDCVNKSYPGFRETLSSIIVG